MMHEQHEMFMRRCLELATLGAGQVAPNPMVGAVLVYSNRIIGEGYHAKYGEAHAEVNCINSVSKENIQLIHESVLYVSLEPCNHFGKTPPCTDLILKYKIQKVVIGCKDSFTKVNGKGIKKLEQNNVAVIVGILENECKELNKRFFIFHSECRPYIVLKWAQTANKKIASDSKKRLLISNKFSNKLVHKWRAHESSILTGTNTAALDNPELTNRLWNGKNPIRLIIDLSDKFSYNLYYVKYNIFNNASPTIIFNLEKHSEFHQPLKNQTYYYKIENKNNLLPEILSACNLLNIQSILVEGGAKTLQSFIDAGLYDEIRIITNTLMFIEDGLDAPVFSNCKKVNEFMLQNDEITIFRKA